MDVARPVIADARAEPGDADRKRRRRGEMLGLRLRPLVRIDEATAPAGQLLGDRARSRARHARGTDQEELLEVPAPAREFEHVSGALHIRVVKIGLGCREPRYGRGMDDDLDLARKPAEVLAAQTEVGPADVPGNWSQPIQGDGLDLLWGESDNRPPQRTEPLGPSAAGTYDREYAIVVPAPQEFRQ
jgi:hypothetical protein